MARTRFENLARDKQEAILEAAAEEFAEKGFEAASINRIIRASGMSKGSVYYYVEDKADLFATTFQLTGVPGNSPTHRSGTPSPSVSWSLRPSEHCALPA